MIIPTEQSLLDLCKQMHKQMLDQQNVNIDALLIGDKRPDGTRPELVVTITDNPKTIQYVKQLAQQSNNVHTYQRFDPNAN